MHKYTYDIGDIVYLKTISHKCIRSIIISMENNYIQLHPLDFRKDLVIDVSIGEIFKTKEQNREDKIKKILN